MKNVPKVACINDLSGYGRCSLSTAIPILSVCGVQPCAAPTAVLSKHTGYSDFHFTDLTDSLAPFFKTWDSISFDGIFTGFLGSKEQLEIVEKFIKMHVYSQKTRPLVIIDTVMGDNGVLYSTYTKEMCNGLKRLLKFADVITPNVTEACFLTDSNYDGDFLSDEQCRNLAMKLKSMGANSVVITGIRRGDSVLNCVLDSQNIYMDEIQRTDRIFSGTGDVFASIIAAFLVRGESLKCAVHTASRFVSDATKLTVNIGDDDCKEIIFEPILSKLGRISEK